MGMRYVEDPRGRGPTCPNCLSPQIPEANDAVAKSDEAFLAARDEIESKLLDLDNAIAGVINAGERFRAKI